MTQRQSLAMRVETPEGYRLMAECVFKLFPEHIQLDEVLALEDLNAQDCGDGETMQPPIVAGEDILYMLMRREVSRLEDAAEAYQNPQWTNAVWGRR